MSKYTSEFTSLNGTNYKIEITTEKGSKSETFVLGGTPFVTEMDSDGKTIYAPIKSTGATIEMLTASMPFDIYSGKTKGVKVTLTNTSTNVVEWVGFVTPCAYDMGLDEEKEVVEIECIDGLAALKDMPYRSSSKEVDTFLNVVFKCLKRVGCYKNLYVTDNVQLTASGTDSIMSKLRISEANFYDEKDSEAQPDDTVAWNCYDVLFEVMQYMGYTMTIEGENVYILDYDAMVKGRNKYFRYSLTGSTIGTPSNVTLSSSKYIDGDSHAENGAKITLDEIYNQVTVVDEFYEIDSLVDGLDSSSNYTNITASSDSDLKSWFKNDSRFLESEVFTVKNKAGVDESFFVTLTKADDGKIFFVVGKFYKHPMIETKHYSHNYTYPSLLAESNFTSNMMYSKIWSGKGANVVGLFTKQIDSSKYNQWRADITSNWDGQSKETKLAQFGQLANIANIGSKKLVNYILCLNQDTNHIAHDKTTSYPFFKIKKNVPTIFGGDGGYIVIKGTLIRHYMYNAPFPMNGTVYRHKDTKATSIYTNEGYFWAQLKWGNYYWKNEGDYKTMGDWVTTPSYFKIFYGDPTKDTKVDEWQDKDCAFYNNCGSLWGVDENGYYVPTPPDGNLNGEVELTIYANKDTKGKWARNNKKDKKNSYSGYPPKVVLFKGLDITVGYSDDAMNEDAASADTFYSADNSTEDNVRQMDEIKCKICTFDNKTSSYSTVDYLDGSGRSQYLDQTYNLATGQHLRQEHHLVYKLVNQYSEPRAILEFNLKSELGIKPYSVLTNKTISGRKFIVQTISNDYKQGISTVELIEKLISMIRLIKYDGVSDKSVKAIIGSGGSSSGSGNSGDMPSRGGSDSDLDRTIWGQSDRGEDIDGSMVVNGNVEIKCIIPPTFDEDDEGDDGEDEELEEGGGNLDVELKITSREQEANNIYAKEHLYIPHPTTKAKTDIVDLLKGYDSRISQNATNIATNTTNIASNKTEIDALKNRVGTAETNITNLQTTVSNHTTSITNNTTNIQANADEIESLKEAISNINDGLGDIDLTTINNTLQDMQAQMKLLKYGSYQHPVVLVAGMIKRYSYANTTSSYYFDGCRSDLITDLSIEVDGGTMTVKPTLADNTSIFINAIHVTQEMSGDTANNNTTTRTTHNTSATINGRNDGAHWFEAYKADGGVKIREFHQKDGNNDSWGSDYWLGDGGGIRAINLTIIGYVYQMS